jgi:formylglycine-generating enzyme required for sulfatase activity
MDGAEGISCHKQLWSATKMPSLNVRRRCLARCCWGKMYSLAAVKTSASRLSRFSRALALVAAICLLLDRAEAVEFAWATVGHAGNQSDPSFQFNGVQFGQVNHEYRISRHEVAIGQYVDFLNDVARSDPYGLWDPRMQTDLNVAGITRAGTSGGFSYTAIGDSNRPISYIGWFDAARFVNWMHNGRGDVDTSTGAYQIITRDVLSATANISSIQYNFQTTATPLVFPSMAYVEISGLSASGFNRAGLIGSRTLSSFSISSMSGSVTGTTSGAGKVQMATKVPLQGALYRLPTADEWYKAAFFSVNESGEGQYFTYATQSDSPPGNQIGSAPNQDNYRALVAGQYRYAVTQVAGSPNPSLNYLTPVGAFSASESFYGTFDQGGNLSEWVSAQEPPPQYSGVPLFWGGNWTDTDVSSDSKAGGWGFEVWGAGHTASPYVGFRLAAPVPEPSTYAMALAGLACGGYSIFRRRKRS